MGTELVLSLGSNLGDSRELLTEAVRLLAATEGIELRAVSSIHRTAPVGPVLDQPDFRNIIVLAVTELAPHTVLDRTQAVENQLGRVRRVPGGPRTMDVDLVAMGGLTLCDEPLVLPHPRAHERAFVLVPWLEVDPEAELVGHGRVADLVSRLDTSGVEATDERIELS